MQISKFIKDVRGEMKNVKWPSKKMVTGSTIAVIVLSLLTSVYLWGIDTGLKDSYTGVVTSIKGEIVSTSTADTISASSSATSTISSTGASTTATTTRAATTSATTTIKK